MPCAAGIDASCRTLQMEEGRLGLNWLRKASEKGHRDAAYAVRADPPAVLPYPVSTPQYPTALRAGLRTAPLALALTTAPSQ
jgi:hypothetical protein